MLLSQKVFFRNNRLSKLTQHHNPLQRSHSKYVENYAITDATVSQMFHKINWINNIVKTEKKPIARARMKRKAKTPHSKKMLSELVHPKLKKSEYSRAWY